LSAERTGCVNFEPAAKSPSAVHLRSIRNDDDDDDDDDYDD
jgi:hypothetical protein